MAKFTAKQVRIGLEATCTVMDWSELEVKGNKEATFNNVAMHLLATAKAIDTAYVFDSKFPTGIQEIVDGYTEQWENLRQQLVKYNHKAYTEFATLFEIVPAYDDISEDPAFLELGIEPPTLEKEEPKKGSKKVKAKDVEEDDEDEEVSDEIDEDEEEDEDVDDEELSDEELEEELDEVLDEEFEDETLAEEETASKKSKTTKGGKAVGGKKAPKGKK